MLNLLSEVRSCTGATAAAAATGLGGGSPQSTGAGASDDTVPPTPALVPDQGHEHASPDRTSFSTPKVRMKCAMTHRGHQRTITRKSASRMTPAEITRFRRAFEWAVAKGYFDVFNDEHYDANRNRQHGADVLAGAPPAVFPGKSASLGLPPAAVAPLVPARGRADAARRAPRPLPPRAQRPPRGRPALPPVLGRLPRPAPAAAGSSGCVPAAAPRSCRQTSPKATPASASRSAPATASTSTDGREAGSRSCPATGRAIRTNRRQTRTSSASIRQSTCCLRSSRRTPRRPWRRSGTRPEDSRDPYLQIVLAFLDPTYPEGSPRRARCVQRLSRRWSPRLRRGRKAATGPAADRPHPDRLLGAALPTPPIAALLGRRTRPAQPERTRHGHLLQRALR